MSQKEQTVKRVAELIITDNVIGAWEVKCQECPLNPQKLCVMGIMTNLQGAVPLGECEHYVKNSAENANASGGKPTLTILCRKVN